LSGNLLDFLNPIKLVTYFCQPGLGQLGFEVAIPELLKALEDQDSTVKKRTCIALGQLGSEAAIAGLLEALEDQDTNVRREAATALGQLNSEAVIPGLLKALEHSNSDIRWCATEGLKQLGSENAVSHLLRVLQDENADVRCKAAEALGQLGSQEAIPGLLSALRDHYQRVRSKAAEALGQLGSQEAIPHLLKALEDKDAKVRWKAATALGQLHSEAAIPGLLRALEDEDQNVRWRAAEALGQLRSEAAIPGLLKALEHVNSSVSKNAATALAQLGSKAAIPGLLKVFEEGNSRVRGEVSNVLRQLASEAILPDLLKLLKRGNDDVRRQAAELLAQLGSKEAIPELLRALQHKSSTIRAKAAIALGQLGSEVVIPELLEALEKENQESTVRKRVAEALAHLGSEAAIPELLNTLEDGSEEARKRASIALGQLGSEAAIPGLLKPLHHRNSDVRKRSALALEQIGSPKPLMDLWQLRLIKEEEHFASTIEAIQERCRFYNYELYQRTQLLMSQRITDTGDADYKRSLGELEVLIRISRPRKDFQWWRQLQDTWLNKFGGKLSDLERTEYGYLFKWAGADRERILKDAEDGLLDREIASVGGFRSSYILEITEQGQCIYQYIPQIKLNNEPSAKFIGIEEAKKVASEIDVLLLTVTEPERKAVLAAMHPLPGWEQLLQGSISYITYRFGVFGRYRTAHCECTMGSGGRDGSGNTIYDAVTELKPKAVLLLGLAFGIDRKKQRLGDVIIAESIFPYDLQKITADVTLYRDKEVRCGEILSERFRTRRSGWKLFQGKNLVMTGKRPVEVHQGVMLSGDKLVNNEVFRNNLLKPFADRDKDGKPYGGEMEGRGAYESAYRAAAKLQVRVEIILIKAICDWADGDKNDRAQPLAAYASVSLAEYVLNQPDVLAQLGAQDVASNKISYLAHCRLEP
jgi:HEAT repeat protein/nucleoside phosphorylase